ncbi:hypothetical protein [Noviherbaspirillum denitrificans]|uniref:hypothetical protein n=1 Tax=Noviherbaspirillum denitrificans TaxID=1968433 RepID=UPI00113293FF|nr:hypothetical protein [Noviherbaspirillum denitrificans]
MAKLVWHLTSRWSFPFPPASYMRGGKKRETWTYPESPEAGKSGKNEERRNYAKKRDKMRRNALSQSAILELLRSAIPNSRERHQSKFELNQSLKSDVMRVVEADM